MVCDGLQVVENGHILVRGTEPAISEVYQQGFAVCKDNSTIVIDHFFLVVFFQMDVKGFQAHLPRQRYVQLGVFLTGERLLGIVPGSEHLSRRASAPSASGSYPPHQSVEDRLALVQVGLGPLGQLLGPASHLWSAG